MTPPVWLSPQTPSSVTLPGFPIIGKSRIVINDKVINSETLKLRFVTSKLDSCTKIPISTSILRLLRQLSPPSHAVTQYNFISPGKGY